ncbi:conserved Plasmodium protein, unknown function [Plasmodium gallinaceum]|uniref:Uncharacterized protein n=1 Tax=Plasmodium gallinaceum TaxID=5849 RepID=A0A1J1GLW8_PLAGA|nr:conserved Plasmodium protein, unknown function [Plasmodium gallinaceum]CRG93221.1 conserved Plasmodium protein, unknown function [Plasmodium gallinaceum]
MIKNNNKKKKDNKKLKKKSNAPKIDTSAQKLLNKKKIDQPPTILRWIQLLRNLKLKQLKKNIDEEISNYEINKNINDKLLLFLNDDLEENKILEKIDELKNSKLSLLVEMHEKNMNNLQKKYEEEIYKMFNDFEQDQTILLKNRNSIIHNINLFYHQLEEEQKLRQNNLKKEELDIMDQIYKNYIAERYISNYKFDKFKEEDKINFNDTLIENKKNLNEENENCKEVKMKYEKNKKCLLSKEKEVHDLESKIDNWKIKLENEIKIYEMQIERLKNEKTQLLNHIRAIKLILQKLEHNDKQRLIDITVNSSNCINKLEENISLANKLINFNNLCRKYETERQKVFSSLDSSHEKKEDIISENEKEEYFKNIKNKNEDDAYLLENFFKRQNKTILDVFILKKELKTLKKKNKEYNKILDELENKVNLNKKVKIKKNEFVIKALEK